MTLSLRPDDRGGFSSMEKWSTPGIGWGNHQQVLNVLEPASAGLNNFYSNSHLLHPQCSIFPQLMRSAEQDLAPVHAFTSQTKTGLRDAHNNVNAQEDYTLLMKSSNTSSSIVESSTSDEECTAPEIDMHCLSALGGGRVSPAVANILDRTRSTGASMMAQDQDFYSLHHPAESPSPGGGSLSPCGFSDESLQGADACEAALMAGLNHRFDAEDEEWIDQMQARKVHKGEQAPALHDDYGAPSSLARTIPSYDSRNQAPTLPSARAPDLQKSAAAGREGASGVDMDSMHSILFRHVSQPVPSLEEIASSRPKRRNVRISKDPQSVAARHRRERISDRMRVLQQLVPGGTKMDTASMLDEAIHYVNFLKLQLLTLEKIGNTSNGVALDSYVQAQAGGEGSLTRRPVDLNYAAAFQAWPLDNNNTGSNMQASQLGRQPHRWA